MSDPTDRPRATKSRRSPSRPRPAETGGVLAVIPHHEAGPIAVETTCSACAEEAGVPALGYRIVLRCTSVAGTD